MKAYDPSFKKIWKAVKKEAKKTWVTAEQAYTCLDVPEHITNYFSMMGLIKTVNEEEETLYNLWDVFKIYQQLNSDPENLNPEDDE